jgi:hypothetical protein
MVYGLQKGLITGIRKEDVLQPRLYPNPAKDSFKVSNPGDQPVGIKVFDLSGRIVYEVDEVSKDEGVSVANPSMEFTSFKLERRMLFLYKN